MQSSFIVQSALNSVLQVGEFYETMGTDAVLLMQWAGLNPMGQGNPPRAGCPVGNIRRTLQSLVQDANLSVVGVSTAWLIRRVSNPVEQPMHAYPCPACQETRDALHAGGM